MIPYYPLTEPVIRSIIGLKLGKVGKRLKENYNATFTYADELVQLIADRCKEVDTGARNIDHILTRSLLPDLSAELLGRLGRRPIGQVCPCWGYSRANLRLRNRVTSVTLSLAAQLTLIGRKKRQPFRRALLIVVAYRLSSWRRMPERAGAYSGLRSNFSESIR